MKKYCPLEHETMEKAREASPAHLMAHRVVQLVVHRVVHLVVHPMEVPHQQAVQVTEKVAAPIQVSTEIAAIQASN